MDKIVFAELTNRALLRITGEDYISFLHNLVTCDVEKLTVGEINFGALLSPQGKILFDFFILKSNESIILDIDKSMLEDFIHRLNFYKLRAKVEFTSMDSRTHVFAVWDTSCKKIDKLVVDGVYAADPRYKKLATRAYLRRVPKGAQSVDKQEYYNLCIKHGMPSGGRDFAFGSAFPHEALMDQFSGVDFQKGCYIGQEVVSRMQHRGSARKRFIMVEAEKELPDSGTFILTNNRSIGELTGRTDKCGLALVRLDKVGEALANESCIFAGTTPIKLKLQPWVNFDWISA